MIRDGIPVQLAECERWVRFVGGKHGATGWNIPANWRQLDEIDGDAMFVQTDSHFLIIDCDHVIGNNGKVYAPVGAALRRLIDAALGEKLYIEYSTSGHGLHIVLDLSEYAGTFAPMTNKKGEQLLFPEVTPDEGTEPPKLEFWYNLGHSFYFTGKKIPGSGEDVIGGDAAANVMREILKMLDEQRQATATGSPETTGGKDDLKVDKATLDKIHKALSFIDPDCDRITWIHVGNALCNIGAPFEWWEEWSARGQKYADNKKNEMVNDWQGFQRSPHKWGAGTIFGLAKAGGYLTEEKTNEPPGSDTTAQSSQNKTIDPKSLLLTLDSVEEESAEWLIPERIPMKTITVIAGDGGSGKTTIWADLAAAVSSGNKPLLAGDIPKAFWEEEPAKVLYFSTEDSTKVVLKAKLRKAGANFANIATVDLSNIEHIKYNSTELAALFEIYKPKLCVFDPLQGYLDARLDMSRRNAIRQGCIAPLSALAEKYGTAIVIIAHSNKRSDAADRGRLADSADIWDGARSVIMVGRTADGLRYAAQEKSNYGPLAETILFTINGDGLASYYGNSKKHDRDFVNERTDQKRNAPAREDAREQLLEALRNAGGSMPAEALKEFANAASITASMLRRVKSDMRKEGLIDYEVEGNAGKGKGTRTIVKLVERPEGPEGSLIVELPELP